MNKKESRPRHIIKLLKSKGNEKNIKSNQGAQMTADFSRKLCRLEGISITFSFVERKLSDVNSILG